eukprot:COSAG01_NODE_59607_length_299_cov_1.030000_1_plen_81_part_01
MHLGSTNMADCVDCPAGHWSAVTASAKCALCPASTHRRLTDVDCQSCKSELGERCDKQGMTAPLAAPGYYATDISSRSRMA